MKSKAVQLLSLLIVSICVLFINAGHMEITEHIAETKNIEYGIMADRIVIKTRIYEGRLQFRRFNATKDRWVDADWINAEEFDGHL